MKKFLKKYKIYVASFAYVLFLVIVYFFIAGPLLSKIENNNNLIKEKMASQENNREKISKLPNLKNQFDKITANESRIKVGLTSNSVVGLLEKIEEISEETGNKVKIEIVDSPVIKEKKETSKSKKNVKKEEENIIDKLPIDRYIIVNIRLAGNYKNFVDFVRKIETLEYYSDITSIVISKEIIKNSSSPNPFAVGELESAQKEMEKIKNEVYSEIAVAFYLEK